MAVTPPPDITAAPAPAPQRGDRATFAGRVDAFITWLILAVSQFAALAANVFANARETFNNASAAADSATAAASSAAIAAAAANAFPFDPERVYEHGEAALSNLDLQSYRRKSIGASAMDPKLDSANWEPGVRVPGIGSEAASGSITLTAVSKGLITVTPTAYGQGATLPDATTLRPGVLVACIYNAGPFPYLIKNSASVVLGFIDPMSSAICALADGSTAAGVWDILGNLPVGIAARGEFSPSGTISSIVGMSLHSLDANRLLFVYSFSSSTGRIDAVVYDKATNTWGAPVLVRAQSSGASAPHFLSAVIDAGRALIVSKNGNTNTDGEAVVLSVAGTAITVNTAATVATTNWPIQRGNGRELVAVGGTWLFGGTVSGNSYFVAVSVSGTTCTLGAEVSVAHNGNGGIWHMLAYDATRALVLMHDGSSTLKFLPVSVSGVAVTVGTAASPSHSGAGDYVIRRIGARILFVLFSPSTFQATAFLVQISGTTATTSTAVAFGSGLFGNTSRFFAVEVFGSQAILVAGEAGGGACFANVLTDAAGVLSAGNPVSAMNSYDPQTGNVAGLAYVGTASVTLQGGNTLDMREIGISNGQPVVLSYKPVNFGKHVNSVGGATQVLACSVFTGQINGETTAPLCYLRGASESAYAIGGKNKDIEAYVKGRAVRTACTSDFVEIQANTPTATRESAAACWTISTVTSGGTLKVTLTRMLGV